MEAVFSARLKLTSFEVFSQNHFKYFVLGLFMCDFNEIRQLELLLLYLLYLSTVKN